MLRTVSVALILALAAAQATTSPCDPENLLAIVACHNTNGAVTIPDHAFWQDDNERPIPRDAGCCASVVDYRSTCSIGDFFDAWAAGSFTVQEQRTLLAYVMSCEHNPASMCMAAATEALACSNTAATADGSCCDAYANMREKCIHFDIRFEGDDNDHNDDEVPVYLPADSNTNPDVAKVYFDDSDICYSFGPQTCESSRQAVKSCAMGTAPTTDDAPCCWVAGVSLDLCKVAAPEETWYGANALEATTRTIMEDLYTRCARKDHDECGNTIPDVYMVNGNMIAPCDRAGAGDFFADIAGRRFCRKPIPNAHAVPDCLGRTHHDNNDQHGSDAGSNTGSLPM